jgi:uncharacterized RDD family membrane protein YckC
VPRNPYGPVAPGGAPLAGFGDRFLARLIDIAVLIVPTMVVELVAAVPFVVVAAAGGETPSGAALLAAFAGSTLLFAILLVAVYYGYEVAMMHRTGQTLGKRALRIRVVREADGGPIDRATATRRWLVGNVAPMVAFGFGHLDVLWLLWDQPYRQCLHDKCAGTVVVKVLQ